MEQNTSADIIQVDPYQDQLWMKPVATFFYVLGLICCVFLGCVVWFERTKKFAPHRTLTQQMTSYSLILVINVHISAQCGNIRILLPPRFYVKSIFRVLEVRKLPFLRF